MPIKPIRLMLMALCLLLGACSKAPTTPTLDEVGQMLDALDYHIVNFVVSHQQDETELLEIVDMRDLDAVQLQVSFSSPNPHAQFEYRLLFTSEHVYDTRTMTKSSHDQVLVSYENYTALIETHANLVTFEWFSKEALMGVVATLNDLTLSTHRGVHTLRGTVMNPTLPEDITEVFMIEFTDTTLVSIRFFKAYDWDSSKKESNYVSGIHFHVTTIELPEFTDLEAYDG